ncbi:hypothetical protein IT575_15045 [bacterium]|nr:hypothetical protein [bacterium]
MRGVSLALLLLIALAVFSAGCNKPPEEKAELKKTESSAGTDSVGTDSAGADSDGAESGSAGSAGEARPQDSSAASQFSSDSKLVQLSGCPVSGLWLPEGSILMGQDDQLPRGWTVSFDTPMAWPELSKHFETLLTARGWSIDTTSQQEPGVIRYKSADSLHFAMLMNAFPDPPEQEKTNEYVQALGEIAMARHTNPDFAFGVYLRAE